MRSRCAGFTVFFSLLLFSPLSHADDLGQELINTVSLGEPATSAFDLDRFKSLVNQGADVNAQDASGQSVLLHATIENAYLGDSNPEKAKFFQAIQILISKGANVNLSDELGLTPLMMAVHRAHCCITDGHPVPAIKPIYDLLLSSTSPKPDLEIRNFIGETALGYLAAWGETAEVQTFLGLGANLYVEYDDGTTIFMAAAKGKTADLFDSLINLVPKDSREDVVNHRNKAGSSLLMGSVRAGNLPLITELLGSYSIDLSPENVGGENALSIAKDYVRIPRQTPSQASSYKSIARLLRSHGAKEPKPVSHVIQCHARNSEPWTFQKISAVVRECGITKLDDLVPLFPATYLSNYSLSYATRGIQTGSFAYPRVISAGSNGKTILAFNGDPSLQGYNTLEMIEAKRDARFEFHEIDFSGEKPSFSKKNPATCLACHGETHPRPRWDNWYLWPGIYNSEQESPYPIEKAHYQDYLANRQTGRYQYLLDPSDSPTRTSLGLFDSSNTFKNTKMDAVMADRNSSEIVGEIVRNPVLRRYKFAILGALSCPNRPEDFLPPQLAASLPRGYDELLAENQALDVAEFTARIQRHQQNLGPGVPQGNYAQLFLAGVQKTGQSYETVRAAKLRYLIEGLKQSMDWSTIFETNQKHYVIPAITELEIKLWSKWLSAFNPGEAELRAMYEAQYQKGTPNVANLLGLFRGADYDPNLPGVDPKPICDLLVSKSLASLKSVALPGPTSEVARMR